MINFTKMHGLGNDYIYISRLENESLIKKEEISSFVQKMSDRHFGIGGDGVIFIDKSSRADFKMSMYNQDGSQAEMCGNGIRCFAKYVYDNKLTSKTEINIETLCGIKTAYLNIENGEIRDIKICMGAPQIGEKIELCVENEVFKITNVSMGNPHAIILVDDVDNFDVQKYGSQIEVDPNFPHKTNVEFVQILNDSNIKMRVWERGTGETFACGTGACATAVACNINGYTKRDVIIHLLGGDLKIKWDKQTNKVYMTGTATKVFEGQI